MRSVDSPPMSEDEFSEALDIAEQGGILSDTGAGEELLTALLAVAREPSGDNITAARAAYRAQSAA